MTHQKFATNFCLLTQRIDGVYRNISFQKLCDIYSVNKGKLNFVPKLKEVYNYEPYLNYAGAEHLTRMRISNHWLPIELGRYTLPITHKVKIHCMFLCNSVPVVKLRNSLCATGNSISSQFSQLLHYPHSMFQYLLQGHDTPIILLPIIIDWCKASNYF